MLAVYTLHALLLSATDRFHLLLLAATLAVLVAAVLLSAAGVAVAVCLIVVMAAPLVTVLGYETIGHRHQREMLERIAAPGH
jgi:Flp pilus assembly protein TadB